MPHTESTPPPARAGTNPDIPTGETTNVATKIRLKRLGKIRSPHYRIIVIDERAKRDGKAIEEVGIYHPKNDPSVIQVNSERVQYWLGVGAQPTEAVVALLKRTGDWQKFSGDTSPSGIEVAPEKTSKLDLFNAALAEDDDAPKTSAITTKGGKDAEAKDSEAKDDSNDSESKDADSKDEAAAETAPAAEDSPEAQETTDEVEVAAEPGAADADDQSGKPANTTPEEPAEGSDEA